MVEERQSTSQIPLLLKMTLVPDEIQCLEKNSWDNLMRKNNFFDGDGEVVSRVRRGVLSLRVVRQMLS